MPINGPDSKKGPYRRRPERFRFLRRTGGALLVTLAPAGVAVAVSIGLPTVTGTADGDLTRRLIKYCCPAVRKLVVIQYTSNPGGKLYTNSSTTNGNSNTATFDPGTAMLADAIKAEAICEST